MIHLKLPYCSEHRLPFYLAMEEWAARTLPPAEYFFSWRVKPTVICGRNQEMDKEVNIPYCREHGIDVVRRRSGGGCVYADMDNFMFSYITPGDEVTTTFAGYTSLIASCLRKLGLEATATGRNDILIHGRKVSGNAFYHLPGRCIAHGTMLFRFNPEAMRKAITPSRAKLESKSVKSVESRVTCLANEGIVMTPEEFEAYIISGICDSEFTLSANDIAEIEAIEETYYAPTFLFRKGEGSGNDATHGDTTLPGQFASHADGYRYIKRFGRMEGVGEMLFTIALDEYNLIRSINISGDFFLADNPENHIIRHLIGVELSRIAIEEALKNASPESAIVNLTSESLLNILCPDTQGFDYP